MMRRDLEIMKKTNKSKGNKREQVGKEKNGTD